MKERKLYDSIKATPEKYPAVERTVLFGSRARGDFFDRSDYDIARYGRLGRKQITEIRNTLDEELPTLQKIDLVFMQDQTDEKFIGNIEREGKIIYGKTSK